MPMAKCEGESDAVLCRFMFQRVVVVPAIFRERTFVVPIPSVGYGFVQDNAGARRLWGASIGCRQL
jgi:hypothetical protein